MNSSNRHPNPIEEALWGLPGFRFSSSMKVPEYEQAQAVICARDYDDIRPYPRPSLDYSVLERNMTVIFRAILFYADFYRHFRHSVFFDAVSGDTFPNWPLDLAPAFIGLLANGRARYIKGPRAGRDAASLLVDLVDRYLGLDEHGSDPMISSNRLPKDENQVHQLWKHKREVFKHILVACPRQLLDTDTHHLTAPTPAPRQYRDALPSSTTGPPRDPRDTRYARESSRDLRDSRESLAYRQHSSAPPGQQQASPPDRNPKLKREHDYDQYDPRPTKRLNAGSMSMQDVHNDLGKLFGRVSRLEDGERSARSRSVTQPLVETSTLSNLKKDVDLQAKNCVGLEREINKLRKQLDTAGTPIATAQDNPKDTTEAAQRAEADGLKRLHTIKAEVQALVQRHEEARKADADARKAHDEKMANRWAEMQQWTQNQEKARKADADNKRADDEKLETRWAEMQEFVQIQENLRKAATDNQKISQGTMMDMLEEMKKVHQQAENSSQHNPAQEIINQIKPDIEEWRDELESYSTTCTEALEEVRERQTQICAQFDKYMLTLSRHREALMRDREASSKNRDTFLAEERRLTLMRNNDYKMKREGLEKKYSDWARMIGEHGENVKLAIATRKRSVMSELAKETSRLSASLLGGKTNDDKQPDDSPGRQAAEEATVAETSLAKLQESQRENAEALKHLQESQAANAKSMSGFSEMLKAEPTDHKQRGQGKQLGRDEITAMLDDKFSQLVIEIQSKQQEFEKTLYEWTHNLVHQRIEAAFVKSSPHHIAQSAGSPHSMMVESPPSTVAPATVSTLSEPVSVPTKCRTLEELSENLAQEAITRARHIKKIDGVVSYDLRDKLDKVTKRSDTQEAALDDMNRKIHALEQHLQAAPATLMALAIPKQELSSPPLPSSTETSSAMAVTDKATLLDKLNDQESRLQRQESMVSGLTKRIESAVSRVDLHETKFSNFEDQVKKNQARIKVFELDRHNENE